MEQSLNWCVLAVGYLLIGTANAAAITIRATGQLDLSQLQPDFSIGEAFTFTYTYDSDAADSLPSNEYEGQYLTAGLHSELVIGDYMLSAVGGYMVIGDHTDVQTQPDYYQFSATQCPVGPSYCGTISGSPIGDLVPYSLSLVLSDPTRLAFDSDALPTTAPQLSSFPALPVVDADGNVHFELRFARDLQSFGPSGTAAYIRGTVTSLNVVPIPPAILLFGSALGVMGWLRRGLSGK